jgi:CHAD domain-containing protein
VKQALERELKLVPGEGFALADLEGIPLESRVLHSTYWDAGDLRLLRAGVTMRYRLEDGRGVWQLKLPRRGGRLEVEEEGGAAAPPEAFRALLRGVLRGAEIEEVARLRTRRSGVRVGENGSQADVLHDAVALVEGQQVLRTWEELEIELLPDADERALGRIGKLLRRAGARPSDGRPKLAQALSVETPRPAKDRSRTTGEALQLSFGEQLAQIARHDPGARLGDDAEDVHQVRVATRRLRAFLRAAKSVVEPTWGDELRAELRWLANALGPVRDLDVLLDYLRAESDFLEPQERAALGGLLERLERERSGARTAMLEALEDDRYLRLLDRLTDAAAAPRITGDEPLEGPWRREFSRLRSAATALPDEPSDEALHELRIKAKRARYAAELGEPVLGKAGRRFVDAAKELQDVLGAHQDAVVAEVRLRTLLAEGADAEAHFAAGRLVERQRARRRSARGALGTAWRELEASGRRAWSR